MTVISFKTNQVPVAHICNPSWRIRGRDQEDHGLKLTWATSSRDPVWKIPITKKAGGVAQGEGPEFKPQYRKQTNKQTKNRGPLLHR
jgi:hypothetical protein